MKLKTTLFLSVFCLSGTLVFSQTTVNNKNIIKKGALTFGGAETSNIWGFKDGTGKEYALVGTTGMNPSGVKVNDVALAIVDVSNPALPVQKFTVNGPNSIWREIRTYGNYAYVTTEGGGGVTIVSLGNLPTSITSKQFTNGGDVQEVHALHIEGNRLYLYGGDNGSGARIFSLADPLNPVFIGEYQSTYIHDGFVKNDTIYACQIFNGTMSIIDTKVPMVPVTINSVQTPLAFAHNSWMSTDRKTIYVTDERPGSYVAAYDISDMANDLPELDRYKTLATDTPIVHNTYVVSKAAEAGKNTDFVVSSYYTEGVTIVDAARPDNLVEVGKFDSSPFSGSGYQGAWGVYPFLPSGNLLISDIEGGLLVLEPTYRRACYLEGVITDTSAGKNKGIGLNAKIKILNTPVEDFTKLGGAYKVGFVDSGLYTVEVTANGYPKKTFENVSLKNGKVTVLNIEMSDKVGINHINNDIRFAAYPNPFNEQLTISYRFNTINKKAYVELIDLLGRKISSYPLTDNEGVITINESIPSGVYIARVVNGDGVNTQYVAKQ